MEMNKEVLTAFIASALTHFFNLAQSIHTARPVLPPTADESRDAYLSNHMVHQFTDSIVACVVDDHWGNPEKWKAVYIAANKVMMQVGYEGQIDTDHPASDELMHALSEVDGGVFDVEKVFGESEVDDD